MCFILLSNETSIESWRYPNFSDYDPFCFSQIYSMINTSKLKFSNLTVTILSFPIALFPDWTIIKGLIISLGYLTRSKFLLCFSSNCRISSAWYIPANIVCVLLIHTFIHLILMTCTITVHPRTMQELCSGPPYPHFLCIHKFAVYILP